MSLTRSCASHSTLFILCLERALQHAGHERTLVVLEVDFDLGTAVPDITAADRPKLQGKTCWSLTAVGQRLTMVANIP